MSYFGRKYFIIFLVTFIINFVYGMGLNDIDMQMTSYLDARFTVFNLFDGKTNTCWAEGVKGNGAGTNGEMVWNEDFSYVVERNGVGEYIQIWSKPFAVDKVVIYNGYQKSFQLFSANNRVKRIGILARVELKPFPTNFNDLPLSERNKIWKSSIRDIITNVQLEDKMGGQEIILKLSNVINLRFTILSTYPGTTYDDTCISEIEFWYQGQKYEVANLEQAKREFVRKRKREKVWGVVMGGIYVVEWRGSKEKSIYGYLTSEGEVIETGDRNYWIHDMVYRTMVVKKTNNYGWRNDVWGCDLEWEIREDGFYYRVREGDMKRQINELKRQGYGVFSYPDEIKKQIRKGWEKIEKGKVVGKWKVDSYGNLWMDMGKGWQIYEDVVIGLMSRYGEGVENVPPEGQTAEFKANNAGSELFIGNKRQGVEVYTLFSLWEQGKLKLPVE
jgi:hypothetical protein